jgi:hypothetical protein
MHAPLTQIRDGPHCASRTHPENGTHAPSSQVAPAPQSSGTAHSGGVHRPDTQVSPGPQSNPSTHPTPRSRQRPSRPQKNPDGQSDSETHSGGAMSSSQTPATHCALGGHSALVVQPGTTERTQSPLSQNASSGQSSSVRQDVAASPVSPDSPSRRPPLASCSVPPPASVSTPSGQSPVRSQNRPRSTLLHPLASANAIVSTSNARTSDTEGHRKGPLRNSAMAGLQARGQSAPMHAPRTPQR